jgi:glycosyltransferase involved in cell wall biosynthesis
MSKIKNDITVIIPVYNLTKEAFSNAITSVQKQIVQPEKLMLVVADGSVDHEYIKSFDFGDLKVTILNHSENTSFATQMNLGVMECTTKWFSFLEQDDELSSIWLDNAIKYRTAYPDVTAFLPLIVDFSDSTENVPSTFIGMSNEAVWAAEFSDEMGILDNASLLKYQNFNFGGMVMLKEVYLDNGGIKESIKLTFMYEFLLRLTFNSTKVMVVPKIGYKHVNLRVGGLFENYRNEMSPDEARWWLATAKREYFHIDDRKVEYEKIG